MSIDPVSILRTIGLEAVHLPIKRNDTDWARISKAGNFNINDMLALKNISGAIDMEGYWRNVAQVQSIVAVMTKVAVKVAPNNIPTNYEAFVSEEYTSDWSDILTYCDLTFCEYMILKKVLYLRIPVNLATSQKEVSGKRASNNNANTDSGLSVPPPAPSSLLSQKEVSGKRASNNNANTDSGLSVPPTAPSSLLSQKEVSGKRASNNNANTDSGLSAPPTAPSSLLSQKEVSGKRASNNNANTDKSKKASKKVLRDSLPIPSDLVYRARSGASTPTLLPASPPSCGTVSPNHYASMSVGITSPSLNAARQEPEGLRYWSLIKAHNVLKRERIQITRSGEFILLIKDMKNEHGTFRYKDTAPAHKTVLIMLCLWDLAPTEDKGGFKDFVDYAVSTKFPDYSGEKTPPRERV